MAGRLTDEARREKARNSLVETITKINDLEPTMGGKWKASMVRYYRHRLAELLLYQVGVVEYSPGVIKEVEDQIESIL